MSYTSEEMQAIVNTTFQQIGGQRAMVMIGGIPMRDGLALSVRVKAGRKVHTFKVAYNPAMDLYDLSFFLPTGSLSKGTFKIKSWEMEGVYAEDLVRILQDETGLAFSL